MRKAFVSLAIVSLFLTVSLAAPISTLVVSAGPPGGCQPWPECKGGGGEEPPADPAISFLQLGKKDKLWVMNADGSNQAVVYETGGLSAQQTWSPNGDAIAFLDGAGRRDLWRINISVVDGTPQGSDPYRLIQNTYYSPAWSPLGDKIAFTRGLNDPPWLIQTVPATGGAVETIYTAPEGYWVLDLTWRSDGSQLAFVELNTNNNQKSIVVLDLSDGSTTTVYGPVTGSVHHLDWARTQDVLAFIRGQDGNLAVVTLDMTEENPTPQVVYDGEGSSPSWSPDDSQLVFGGRVCCKGKSYGAVFVYEFSTGNLVELSRGYYPDWSRHVST